MIDTSAPFASAADAAAFARVPWRERLPASDLPNLVLHAAGQKPQATAMRFLPNGRLDDIPQDISYASLARQLLQAAARLAEAGVGPGDRVAFLTPNGPATLITVLAAQAVGIAAPVNSYLNAPEIAALLDSIDAKLLVADGELVHDKLDAVLAHCRRPPRIVKPAELIQGEPLERLPQRGDDMVGLFHTGGTTGLPKLVPLTADQLAVTTLFSAYAYRYVRHDRVLAAMPMFHVGGLLASALFPLACGASVVIAGTAGYRGPGTVDEIWKLVQRERISVLTAPPTIMGRLALDMPEPSSVPALRLLTNGAAALPVAIGDRLVRHFNIPLTEPWGLTEATLAVTAMPVQGERRGGSVGVALPYCQVKAVHVDGQGRETGDCATDEIGVLAIKGPSVFGGYLGLPTEKQPFFKDGWLDSGDLGRIDAEGYVWITGRAKDLIKRGGHGLDPAMIESVLYRHPAVALAAAVGKPDAYAGELPIAYVQLKPGAHCDQAELLELCAQIPERAAIPKELIILPAMPLTGVGKVDKTALRRDAAQRTLQALLDSELPAAQARVEVLADPRHGTLVRVWADAGRHAGVAETLSGFPFHYEVRAPQGPAKGAHS
ncbi:AMP-binding protein [Pusillimonas noertemannii]|uniref:Fatty-acyl-CoA synthase n=1 Tax=Pusillimonas noertemannii TaxID=305977 RepID=A0A2U1CQ49_9BURK|nr:AMP-binding protein [Pusillimonas noertemannii]NYT67334.1 AMP-binding protein [Pusillimonas noertemannii]PVY68008.1 fatty-acyl-CoA synthase [Pusillimonas noertemannii]TFL12479.1 acyl-CoA synthetase [Pusillimonas noertemannii]